MNHHQKSNIPTSKEEGIHVRSCQEITYSHLNRWLEKTSESLRFPLLLELNETVGKYLRTTTFKPGNPSKPYQNQEVIILTDGHEELHLAHSKSQSFGWVLTSFPSSFNFSVNDAQRFVSLIQEHMNLHQVHKILANSSHPAVAWVLNEVNWDVQDVYVETNRAHFKISATDKVPEQNFGTNSYSYDYLEIKNTETKAGYYAYPKTSYKMHKQNIARFIKQKEIELSDEYDSYIICDN